MVGKFLFYPENIVFNIIYFRLPSRDNTTVTRKSDNVESAHILSPDFSCAVTAVSTVSIRVVRAP